MIFYRSIKYLGRYRLEYIIPSIMPSATPRLLLLMPDRKQTGSYQWCYAQDKDSTKDTSKTLPVATPKAIVESLNKTSVTPVLVLPAKTVIMRSTSINSAQRKHISKTVPWLFEEDLPVPVEQLHFAHAVPGASSVDIVAVPKLALQEHLDTLSASGLDPKYVVAAAHLLPRKKDAWHCYYDGELLSISTSANTHYLCDSVSATTMLGLLTKQYEPKQIHVWVTETELLTPVKALFKRIQPKPKYSATLFLNQFRGTHEHWPINLLQGAFRAKIVWETIWKNSRLCAASIAILATLYTASSVADYRTLLRDSQRLNTDISTLGQSVYPDTTFDTHEGMRSTVEKELLSLTEGVSERKRSQFSVWLNHVGHSLQVSTGIVLRTLNYNQRKNNMHIEFQTPNYEAIESIRDALKKRGIESFIKSSAAKGGIVQTRMECTLSAPL